MGRLNFQIPDDLHRDVRVAAAQAGIPIRRWVVEVLRAALSVRVADKGEDR